MIFTGLFNFNASRKLTFTSLQIYSKQKKTFKFINLIKKTKKLHKFTSTSENINILPMLHIY